MRTLADLAGSIPVGVVVVDPESNVLLQNSTARGMLKRDNSVQIVNGVLTSPDRKGDLRNLIQAAANGNGELHVACIPRSKEQHSLTLAAARIEWQAEGNGSGAVAVAVVLSDPDLRWTVPCPILQAIYGFTPAEAELASQIANGKSLEDIASESETSLNTVRSHLKKVFQKTGTRRQAELVRILLLTSILMGSAGKLAHATVTGRAKSDCWGDI